MSDTPESGRLRPESFISGEEVPSSRARQLSRIILRGKVARLEPLDPARHCAGLFAASHADEAARSVWTYLADGPFVDEEVFLSWLKRQAAAIDPTFYVILDRKSRNPVGMASFMRVAPEHGSLEIGNIWFAPTVQRTTLTTEALILMIRHAFEDLKYRRVEWKCNALNRPSRQAALRLGFRFEGIFYRLLIIKGRNRDTAWYSIVSEEWPAVCHAYDRWLNPDNFDAEGRQQNSLAQFMTQT